MKKVLPGKGGLLEGKAGITCLQIVTVRMTRDDEGQNTNSAAHRVSLPGAR